MVRNYGFNHGFTGTRGFTHPSYIIDLHLEYWLAGTRQLQQPAASLQLAAAPGRRQFFQLNQLHDIQFLFLDLHAAILEPDIDLSLGEAERVCDLDATFTGEVSVELKLFLQLQSLVARVRLTTAPTLQRVRTYKPASKDNFSAYINLFTLSLL